jgi:hypothetical protein
LPEPRLFKKVGVLAFRNLIGKIDQVKFNKQNTYLLSQNAYLLSQNA